MATKALNISCAILVSIFGLAATDYAQVPPSNDTSDQYNNTGVGSNALGGGINAACQVGQSATSKCYNTGVGYSAIGSIATGANYNTAIGFVALWSNTSGFYNTASGAGALESNSTGNDNTAIGFGALSSNILGDNDTFPTGSYNTASGAQALYRDTTGSGNVAAGYKALYTNTTGVSNSADGVYALYSNTTGNYNVAAGSEALNDNTSGNANLAFGIQALHSNTTGSSNIGVGYAGGYNLTTGSNNIDIGNVGAAGESGAIRIGASSKQTSAYIAGIYGTSVSGSAVMVSSTGQLGVAVSSERFKTSIATMGVNTAKLQQLRPVTFHLKTDPKGALQYGLIAEEVTKVYPELVIRDQHGRIDGVRYDELAPMLLNEAQRQQLTIAAQAAEIRKLKQQMADLQDFKQELKTALTKLQSKDEPFAQR